REPSCYLASHQSKARAESICVVGHARWAALGRLRILFGRRIQRLECHGSRGNGRELWDFERGDFSRSENLQEREAPPRSEGRSKRHYNHRRFRPSSHSDRRNIKCFALAVSGSAAL